MADVGWTEEARQAALAARRAAIAGGLKSLNITYDDSRFAIAKPSRGRFSMTNTKYKVAKFNPKTNNYHVIDVTGSFPDAYYHPEGTHVIQINGTADEAEQQHKELFGTAVNLTPEIKRGSVVARAGIGFLLGGPIGAAIGAATASPGSGGDRNIPQHALPVPIITPKPGYEASGVDPVLEAAVKRAGGLSKPTDEVP